MQPGDENLCVDCPAYAQLVQSCYATSVHLGHLINGSHGIHAFLCSQRSQKWTAPGERRRSPRAPHAPRAPPGPLSLHFQQNLTSFFNFFNFFNLFVFDLFLSLLSPNLLGLLFDGVDHPLPLHLLPHLLGLLLHLPHGAHSARRDGLHEHLTKPKTHIASRRPPPYLFPNLTFQLPFNTSEFTFRPRVVHPERTADPLLIV